MNANDWDARYQGKELVWTAGPNRFLVEEVDALAPGRALDIACGEGRNALWLAEKGWQVRAFDFSPVAIEKARGRATVLSNTADFQIGDIEDSIVGTYDLIIIFYLHVERPAMKRCLEKASACLAPGGTLLYVGHDQRNIADGIGGPQDPNILYGPDELSQLLPELQIEKAETVSRPVEKEGVVHHALDVLVRARRPA